MYIMHSKCMDDDQWQIFPGDPAGKKLGIEDRFPLIYLMAFVFNERLSECQCRK
jgi:hypothetical protein